MHEMGIIIHLARTLDKVAEENHVTRIGSVTLSIGEVSGIVTDYFSECWDYFKKKHPLMEDSVLKIETIPAITHCDACGRNYDTLPHGKTCPHCGSGETWLIQGNECIIKQIEAETADPEEQEGD